MCSRLRGFLPILLLIFCAASPLWCQTASSNDRGQELSGASDKQATSEETKPACVETAPVAMLDHWNRLVVEYFDARTGSVCREANVRDGEFVAAAFDSSTEMLFGVRGDSNLVAYSLANGTIKTLDEARVDVLAGTLVLDAAHHWLVVGVLQFFYDEEGRLYRMADESPVEMIKS